MSIRQPLGPSAEPANQEIPARALSVPRLPPRSKQIADNPSAKLFGRLLDAAVSVIIRRCHFPGMKSALARIGRSIFAIGPNIRDRTLAGRAPFHAVRETDRAAHCSREERPTKGARKAGGRFVALGAREGRMLASRPMEPDIHGIG